MRRLVLPCAAALLAAALPAACDRAAPDAPAPARFAAVGHDASRAAAQGFCERQWPPAPAAGAQRYGAIPERPLAGAPASGAAAGGTWTWVNLWATWCLPCREEMPLLARWQQILARDGVGLELELWSVDADGAALADYLETTAVPGRVRWLRSPADLPAALAALGADPTAGVPIHALVDRHGYLRCLRVGAVHVEDYGAVKTLLTAP